MLCYGCAPRRSTCMKPVLIIIGTRPEGIKMLPVFFALKKLQLPAVICATSQHDQLLNNVFSLFGVTPDIDLRIMREGQDLFYVTTVVLEKVRSVISSVDPSLVLVQGDTTSAMAGALAAFYMKIPVGHVEAGLRTRDVSAPYPEEFNRRTISLIARYHFAPTMQSAAHLLAQSIPQEHIFCTGNTVVDALRFVQRSIAEGKLSVSGHVRTFVDNALRKNLKIILLTAHRRESFEGGIGRILQAAHALVHDRPDCAIIYPVHPNPVVAEALAKSSIAGHERFCVIPAVSYHDLVFILSNAHVVMTDSGGIQEEAVSLGKKVIVLRERSERMEGVWEGLAQLAGTNVHAILAAGKAALDDVALATPTHVYGDGRAADRIAMIIKQYDNAPHFIPARPYLTTPLENFAEGQVL